jgi:hypothetical protein
VKLKFAPFISALSALVASVSITTPAHAGSIGLSAVGCQPQGVAQTTLLHEWSGVDVLSAADAQPVIVNCSVPRSPLTSDPAAGTFEIKAWIPGDTGGTVPCTLFSYEFTGTLLASVSFSLSSPVRGVVTQQVSLPPAQLGVWAYTSLTCALPPHFGAFLTSITSMH